jgi:hypothetical protein
MKLVIEDETGTRSVVPFASDEITVGRSPEGNTFRLTDRDVSRRHARFVRASNAIHVEDLGSLNGTRVNGERIAGRRRLREGDLVEIGEYHLALLPDEVVVAPGAPPPLPRPVRPRDPPAPAPRPRPAAPRRRTRATAGFLVAGALALVIGALLGFAAGTLTAPAATAAPAPADPTRP